jgi:MFS family permease
VTSRLPADSPRPDWRPLVACCLATFLLLAYTTIVTVSAEVIVADLGAGFAAMQWIIDVYTLGLAALVLAMGTLGDRIGHRRLLLGGLAAFAVAALLCAAAPTGALLIAGRALQGIGGAALFAAVVPLLTHRYTGRARATAFAVWGAVAGAGSSVGTVAGGAVTEFVSWRWMFVAAVPICAVAWAVGATSLPRERPQAVPFDIAGVALITTAMSGLTFAVINAGEHGATSTATVLALGVALVACAAFVPAQRRSPAPVLPADLFATRGFIAVAVVAFAYYFGAFAALPVLSRWLHSTLGLTPLQTALVLTAQLVTFTIVTLGFSARLHDASRAWVLGGGTVLTGLGSLAGVVLLGWPHWTALIAVLAVTGLGAGLVSPVLPAVAATSVPPARAGTGGSAANAARQLGLTIGVAVCGTVAHHAAGPAAGAAAALIACGVVATLGGAAAALLLRNPVPTLARSTT